MALGKLGKYERVDVLGHGASGIVYLAWDTLLKKQIALKEIDLQSADMTRFLEEARVMDRLSHPNIVRVNGVDTIGGHVLIDMEYVKGQNLQQILRQESRLPMARALHIAIQTLDALDYAHRMRTVHRDIKPANILISQNDEVKLVDFGLAEILATNSYAGGAGTYAYMAPEDFAEEHHSDHQSDIWAVGVTLYEMVTGARPFNVNKPKDPFAWRRVLLNDPAVPLSTHMENVPEGLQAVLDRAFAKNKADRYQTAGAFRDDLEGILKGVASVAHKGNGGDVTQRFSPPSTVGINVAASEAMRPFAQNLMQTAGSLNGNGATASPQASTSGLTYPAGMPPIVADAQGGFILPEIADSAESVKQRGRGRQTSDTAEEMLTVSSVVPPKYSDYPARSAQQEEAPVEEEAAPRRSLLRRRAALPARVQAEPEIAHFGELRKGDERILKVRVNFEGGEGKVAGRVVSAPLWATVFPPVINKRRQTLTITAHSERVWEVGSFEDSVRLETTAGAVSIPVTLRVLPARKRFSEVAFWFVPLFLSVLLPAITVAWGSHFAAARFLVPAAALGSGLLAAMLLLVSVEADLGFFEKMACGILLAVMTMVLGVTVGVTSQLGHADALARLPVTGLPIGFLFAAQLVQRRHWKFWSLAIILLSLLTSGIFATVLANS